MSWHIEGCTGACLACLIEETVLKNYGTQGLDFLRRKVGAGDTEADGLHPSHEPEYAASVALGHNAVLRGEPLAASPLENIVMPED